MERSYIAFISYRHLPLEMATAKKLHKRIEHYVIPRDLRKDGRKKPGLVFRDQDELPTSSNLNDNIREALDRSQFLIVICTPETAKSPWVLREITCFLEHHDRNHVLAVLADGTPTTAFPKELTELRSESGDLLEEIEPLAANIVADNDRKRARLFRTESLRILASLVGCPFDALYRRELRFRRRRAAAAIGVTALIAAAFIGMLLNRNAEIRAQLQRALISESRTLAALSEQAYREGDYSGALRYALQALPDDENERPYVGEAEFALSRELDLYRQGVQRYVRSIEQDAGITHSALSPDGVIYAASDEFGALRCWNLDSGSLLWQRQGGQVIFVQFLDAGRTLLTLDADGIAAYTAQNGDELWSRRDVSALDLLAVSKDEKQGLMSSLFTDGGAERLSMLDLTSGETLGDPLETGSPSRYCASAALSEDKTTAALVLMRLDGQCADLCIWQVGGSFKAVEEKLPFAFGSTGYRLSFRPDGSLLLACDDHNGQSWLRLYAPGSWTQRFETPIDTEKLVMQTDAAANPYAGIDLLESVGNYAAVGCKHDLYMIDLRSGGILWHQSLSGFLLAAKLYDNACLALVLSDGRITFCTDDGFLSDTAGIFCFRCGYSLVGAAISGDSYPESSVVVVPEDFSQRAALIRSVDNPQMFAIGSFSSNVSRVITLVSPDGSCAVCLGYDPTGKAVEALPIDAAEGETKEPIVLLQEGVWDDPALITLTDDGKLTAPLGSLDLATQSFSSSEAEPAAEESVKVIARMAENGLAAFWDGENLLIKAGGKMLKGPVLPATTVKLLFSPGGEELLAFSETGEVCVIRCSDGELLGRFHLSALQLHFRDAGAHYTAADAVKEDRLLIFYDDLSRDEAVCLVYDRESQSLAGAYEAVTAYLPGRNAVLVCPMMDGVYVSPFRSRTDIASEAQSRVGLR